MGLTLLTKTYKMFPTPVNETKHFFFFKLRFRCFQTASRELRINIYSIIKKTFNYYIWCIYIFM